MSKRTTRISGVRLATVALAAALAAAGTGLGGYHGSFDAEKSRHDTIKNIVAADAAPGKPGLGGYHG